LKEIRIRKGLDVPLAGSPEQVIRDGKPIASVAVMGSDTVGLRPRMEVAEGDRVKLGQTLFRDRGNEAVGFTAPGAGVVEAVNRGQKRVLQSVVIRLEGDAAETWDAVDPEDLISLPRQQIVDTLTASGDWTAFRTRPFSKIPAPDTEPRAIFVTAIDTNPHAADPAVVLAERRDDFKHGLAVLGRLTTGKVYVCTAAGSGIEVDETEQRRHYEFSGPHPAGLVGTHIHFLEPVGESKTIWHLGYQDVVAIGRLFTSGQRDVGRVVALGGPVVSAPGLLRTRLGASITDLVREEVIPMKKRIISGSILAGRRAIGPIAYLGCYHTQVSALPEGGQREFLAWARPGRHRFSAARAFASHLLHKGSYSMTTSQNGSPRAMVSIGSFERVMPLDILATPLLKALLVGDSDSARDLGCLELDEEDLALCSFVCNGKYEYGPFLRENLTEIEVNG
jgi:Na+-transporting NADH:ubiquinone oxidoreductase subunit A